MGIGDAFLRVGCRVLLGLFTNDGAASWEGSGARVSFGILSFSVPLVEGGTGSECSGTMGFVSEATEARSASERRVRGGATDDGPAFVL